MKRDMDLVRDLLLQIEAKDDGTLQLVEIDKKNWAEAQVAEHRFLLIECGFINGVDFTSHEGREYKPQRLTFAGHDFLDSIRDSEIWAETKAGAHAAGGWTVELLGEIAKGLIKNKIEQHTGIKL